MAFYTKEQIEKANNKNLEEYLMLRGERLKRAGSEQLLIYRDSSGEHDSISVHGNRWYDHKNKIGGYPIMFMQKFYGLSFREAMNELLNNEMPMEKKNAWSNEKRSEPKTKDFILPPKVSNMKRLFAYLIKTRFIAKDVVKHFVDSSAIYQEEKYNGIVFVGMDGNGKAMSASIKNPSLQHRDFKMTVKNSNADYGFCHRGSSKKLFVFEAAVDLMSYITLNPENWQENNYLSLDGLSPKPMMKFVDEKEIEEINICIDNDSAGIESYDKFKDMLIEKGYKAEQVIRQYPAFKDWNEILKAENGITPVPAQVNVKKQTHNKVLKQLIVFNSRNELPYMRWKEQQFEKYGLTFYLKHTVKEIKQIETCLDKAEKNICEKTQTEENVKMLEGSILRVADLSLYMMSKMQADENMPLLSVYSKISAEMQSEYKPYKDKAKWKNYISNIKEEIDVIGKNTNDSQFLFSCLKRVAETAVCAATYLKTEYKEECARREHFYKNEVMKEEVVQKEGLAIG